MQKIKDLVQTLAVCLIFTFCIMLFAAKLAGVKRLGPDVDAYQLPSVALLSPAAGSQSPIRVDLQRLGVE